MSGKKGKIITLEELFPDYKEMVDKWNADLVQTRVNLENAIDNLTHLTVDIKIDPTLSLRRTQLDLISGDVTIILPSMPSQEDLAKIQAEALKMAQDNLDKRLDTIIKIIKVICDAISPTGPLNGLVKNLADAVKPASG